jgi:hypothetical protein
MDAKAPADVHETEEIMGSTKIRHNVILRESLRQEFHRPSI